MSTESDYRVLRALAAEPSLTQRDLASRLGISVGKVNYSLRALVREGMIEVTSFSNKRGHAYTVTRAGIAETTRIAHEFLRTRAAEYEQLRRDIDEMERQLGEAASA